MQTQPIALTDYSRKESKRPSVHFVLWGTGLAGAETITNHYVNNFFDRWELYAFSLRHPHFGFDLFDRSKVEITYGHPRNWRCWLKYYRYVRKHAGGVFHLVNVGPVILLITLLAGIRKPIYHIHQTRHWKSRLKKPVIKMLWGLCSFFDVQYIANSRHCASEFRRKVLQKDLNLIYNGFSVGEFIEKRRRRQNVKRIGYLGRFMEGKNVELVIRLFEEVAGTCPELELLLAGDGPLRHSLEEQVNHSPFRQQITFLGWVEDVASFYAGIDLLLFLSDHESFGNVLVEAILTGLPVLTSNLPVFAEIHGMADTFSLGDLQDYEELRANFLEAVDRFPELAAKAWAASDSVSNTFNIERHLAAIEDLYERY